MSDIRFERALVAYAERYTPREHEEALRAAIDAYVSVGPKSRARMEQAVLEHFHGPDAGHGSWWLRPSEVVSAVLAAWHDSPDDQKEE